MNRLQNEKSPYLLQHKDNPVNWYPWGEEAFAAARRENKPIFLSIGYSTCYWCHVMEKDSFETQEAADVLNRHFISIKVDREERPDIDAIYMDAIVSLSGHGGWPMSVFLTPDLKPFWGGTFFYRAQFISILEQISGLWQTDNARIQESAAGLTEFLRERTLAGGDEEVTGGVFARALSEYEGSYDAAWGGFGGAPKFPPSQQVSLLLRIFKSSGKKQALEMALQTLDSMARGGIYDHIGGGFHRYATDEKWIVPHFEKMLYDNALLSVTFLEAYQAEKKPYLAEVARQILDFVLREMTDPGGGFYSALDAGEVGKEGEFYVWKEDELKSLLAADEYELLASAYTVTTGGNFEHGTNIICLKGEAPWETALNPQMESVRRKLLAARDKRARPHLDDKVLTAWNGLMISGFAKGYQVLGDKKYLEAAQGAASFIRDNLFRDNRLLRRSRDREAGINGFLEDYAYFVCGLIDLYQSDFDTVWLNFAKTLQDTQDALFWDPDGSGYFSSDAPDNIVKKKDFVDSATPSPNSVALGNLVRLHGFYGDGQLNDKREALTRHLSAAFLKHSGAFSRALQAVHSMIYGLTEVVISEGREDAEAQAAVTYLRAEFFPDLVTGFLPADSSEDSHEPLLFKGRRGGDKTRIYVCRDKVCAAPAGSAKELEDLLKASAGAG